MNLKKAISLLLALCLCVSLLPMTGLADTGTLDQDKANLVLVKAKIKDTGATKGAYDVDTDVYIVADDVEGQVFDKWSIEVDGYAVNKDANAYLTIRDTNTKAEAIVSFKDTSKGHLVTITAEYKKLTLFALTVNGEKIGDYEAGADVTITAYAVDKDSNPFLKWTFDGYTVDEDTAKKNPLSFKMPAQNVTATAVYDVPTLYTLTVDGKKIGDYKVGADVTIEAPATKDGNKFQKWSSTDYAVLNDVTTNPYTFTMPAQNVTVTSVYEEPTPSEVKYTVTFKVVNGAWDDGKADNIVVELKGVEGDELKLAADQIPAVGKNPDFGFKAGKWDVTPSTTTVITKNTTYTYTFEKDDTPYGGGGSGATTYKVNVPTETKYGTITATPSSASKGTKVTLKLNPADGFTAVKPTVLDKNGNPIEVTVNADGTFSFIMPDGEVTVKGGFKGKFVDVEPEDPFFDAVYWAAAKGITLGTDETHFSPNASCTRAMFVTFLWRAAGQPAASGTTCKFVDVLPGTYYYDAVVWAAETGVTLGTDDTHFTPDRVVTRAEAFTFVYRYEKLIGNGFTGLWSFTLDDYADHAEVPEYAYEPFCWMVKEGRIEGNLAPNAVCPRYQIVMLLQSVFG